MAESLIENPVFVEILRRYVQRAEQVISREVSAQGLVLTGEMLNSIKAAAVEKGTGWIQANVYYEALLRIKDLKTLNYSRMPPLSAMIKFVEQVGVQNFKYTPGYPRGVQKLDHQSRVERIAWGVRNVFRQEPNIKRGYRGVYNDPLKNQILPHFFTDLRQHAGLTAMTELRLLFTDTR
ncbi:hypothetical protein GCM10010967_11990 [Dyadobacter beijingensis]|uniref:Uncharacterized protein n=1 Tax=Dyadobacter beijingensis TaxID=365489 RepID=A0ABQ2HJA2_9BACT|nr:hypothetical protein [Dyadobacter beijingensis]GGM81833.1 hypothetical protein GCM10010967_11990 [Dyadobacter beijingensis]